ncbi:MAG TPA: glycoside hydrolase family 25 protein [Burkholderiales bacterium]|nr:glycoside hydrolase family 25 protein [Burkholderiales bacterium]
MSLHAQEQRMTNTMNPLVVDCYQGEDVKDWTEVYAFGIRGVIHKASEGSNFRDKVYAMRKERARKAGLLYGAYHFMNDTDIEAQVANFLEAAQPDADLLLALDYEENKHRTGSLKQARRFLQLVYEKTGQRPVLYSGNLIKEQLRRPDAFFNQHRLWIAHYNAVPKLPAGWSGYWLHQYTGDGAGPGPHDVPGISTKGIDLNVFGGEDLASEWAPKGAVSVVAMTTADTPLLATAEQSLPVAETDRDQESDTPGASFWDRFNFKVLDDLAEKGSRTATSLKSFKGIIWKGTATTITTGGAAATLVDPNKGTAQIVGSWGEQHPFLLAAICTGVVAVVLIGIAYYFAKKIEKGLAAAAKDGRYLPRGATP